MARHRAFRETPLRRAAAATVAAATGCAYAAVLLLGLTTAYPRNIPAVPKVRFATTASVSETPASPVHEAVPERPGELPVNYAASQPEKPRKPQPPKPKNNGQEHMTQNTPAEIASSKPIEATPVREPTADEKAADLATKTGKALPPLPDEDIYAPLRGRVYTEKPGGSVLVLALLLDEHGNVLTAKVMVPSGNPIGDLTYLMSLPGTNIGPPDPPIPPGELRWVELRFRYEDLAIDLP